MGVVLNPVGYRIGYLNSWSDAWYVHRIYYPVFLHNMLLLKSLIFFMLYLYFPSKFSYWIYSHVNIYLFKNKLFLNIFMYNAFTRDAIYDVTHWMRWGKFKKIRFQTFWLKKQLIDYNRLAQRWFIIMQCMNIPVNTLSLEHPSYRFKFFKGKKIRRLKLKHYKNKKDWHAREEIALLRHVLFIIKRGYNRFGSRFLKGYYTKWYYKIFKFEKLTHKKDILLKILKNNYKFLFYIISFFDFVLKNINPLYPKKLFRVRDMRFFLDIYFFWFIHRPIFFQFGKFIEFLVFKFDNKLDLKVKFFMVDNASVNADFLARYIGAAIKLRFGFRDIMIPIRKNLKKLMYIRKLKSKKAFEHYSNKFNYKLLSKVEKFANWINNRMLLKFLNLIFRLRTKWLARRMCF